MKGLPKRPRDCAQLGNLVVRMATGQVPNDKAQVHAVLEAQAAEPTGHAKSAKARAASQTKKRRSEIARKAAQARWDAVRTAAAEAHEDGPGYNPSSK